MATKKKTAGAPKPPAAKLTLRVRYEGLHRLWDGLVLACLLIVVVGGFVAGASTITIVYRATIAIAILLVLGRIIIRSWALWEELKRGETQTSRR